MAACSSYFVYDGCLFLQKVSVLIFIGRIFPPYANSSIYNKAIWLTHAANGAWLVGNYLDTIFMCDPVAKSWYHLLPGKCSQQSALWIGCTIPSVIVDLMILCLPLPKIRNLHTSRKRRWAIVVVFILGYSVVVVSIGRLIKVMLSLEGLDKDFTYEIVSVEYWTSAEISISLMAICFPALLSLGRHVSKLYTAPLTSKLSSIFKSHSHPSAPTGNSLSKSSEQGELDLPIMGISQGDKNTHNSEFGSQTFLRSHETMDFSPGANHYSAGIRSCTRDVEANEIPAQAVWMESEVHVSRR
ncbi:hypothetical protein F4778DRAFT_677607 [Xylariomycetidae sp. FL2044]|nr:hypothetical protein F4778DRAFT_677607 [Xylariomycetidae sp. FL2044]